MTGLYYYPSPNHNTSQRRQRSLNDLAVVSAAIGFRVFATARDQPVTLMFKNLIQPLLQNCNQVDNASEIR